MQIVEWCEIKILKQEVQGNSIDRHGVYIPTIWNSVCDFSVGTIPNFHQNDIQGL